MFWHFETAAFASMCIQSVFRMLIKAALGTRAMVRGVIYAR